jgi:hypothetical protein
LKKLKSEEEEEIATGEIYIEIRKQINIESQVKAAVLLRIRRLLSS